MRLRRPRCRCPAGADAEAEAAAAVTVALARTQHFSPYPAPRGRGSGRASSTPYLADPLSPDADPFPAPSTPPDLAHRSAGPPLPSQAQLLPGCAPGSRSSLPGARGRPRSTKRRGVEEEVGEEAGCQGGQWAVGGGHISASPAGVPRPGCWRRRLLGLWIRSPPAKAERQAGTDWAARGDAGQPPDAATAPLRAPAPEAPQRSFRRPPHPTPGAGAR